MSKSYNLLVCCILLFISCNTVTHLANVEPSYYEISLEKETADATITDLIAPYKNQLDAEMDEVIAEAAIDLTKEQPESTLGNFVADLMQNSSQTYFKESVDFSVVNYGGLRIPAIPKGSVTKGKIFELMPFENRFVLLYVDATTVQQFFNLMAAKGGWPISKEVSYKIKDGKAIDIKINGYTIEKDKTYKIAISDYIANGGDKCFFFKNKKRKELPTLIRGVFLEYIEAEGKKNKPLTATKDGRVTLINN